MLVKTDETEISRNEELTFDMREAVKKYAKLACLYLVATCGGFAFYKLGVPLPWMIGPLVVTAILVFFGVTTLSVPVKTRPFGQGVVAAQVGLAFSPAVFASLLERVPLLVGAAFATLFLGFIVAFVYSRLAGIRMSTALVATLPTSPVEASVVAEKYGFPMANIILSQTLRISFVVVLIPVTIYYIDGTPGAQASRFNSAFDPVGTVMLALLSFAGVLLFRKLRISNPYFLGPLGVVSVTTALGADLPPYPSLIVWAAQVVLGTWLGSTFRRALFVSAGRMVTASLISTFSFILVSGLAAVGAAHILGMHWETLVLATAPGGVTEMALTAKFLGEDVALITAFHIVRIFIIVPSIPFMVRWLHDREID